jgi:hypothetical protein
MWAARNLLLPLPMRGRILGVVLLASVQACTSASTEPDEPPEGVAQLDQRVQILSSAYCSIQVTGKGSKDTELDYLPHVIACENNGAGLEALKAQAIAARSVAYYNMASEGSICDSQGCQVYSCNNQPQPIHFQAVAETAQQYLTYAGMLTYGFYVAGDSGVSGPDCLDVSGGTTKYVTHNDGKSGTSVKQTKLGYVGPPGFGQNRGCMSQWGARCLESSLDHLGILRFYYGSDIGITTAPGACSVPDVPGSEEPTPDPGPSEPPSPGASSCQGLCGSADPAPGSNPGCYCDETCSSLGDCCSDYAQACGGSAPEPEPTPPEPSPSGPSCAGICDSLSPAPGSNPACYCDVSCTGFGDCCSDYGAFCQ